MNSILVVNPPTTASDLSLSVAFALQCVGISGNPAAEILRDLMRSSTEVTLATRYEMQSRFALGRWNCEASH